MQLQIRLLQPEALLIELAASDQPAPALALAAALAPPAIALELALAVTPSLDIYGKL
jgi:hypothetical protein